MVHLKVFLFTAKGILFEEQQTLKGAPERVLLQQMQTRKHPLKALDLI